MVTSNDRVDDYVYVIIISNGLLCSLFYIVKVYQNIPISKHFMIFTVLFVSCLQFIVKLYVNLVAILAF